MTTFDVVTFKAELAEAFSRELDKVMSYEPYRMSGLDQAALGEVALAASARVNHVLDILNTDPHRDFLYRLSRGSQLYKDLCPGYTMEEDRPLYDGRRRDGTFLPTWGTLYLYGPDAVRERKDVRFASVFGYTATAAMNFSVEAQFSNGQADTYLDAAHAFTQQLFTIGHISEDGLLKEPFMELGAGMAAAFKLEPTVLDAWEEYLDETLGVEDLIGEDGAVMEDMTESLLEMANDWFALKTGIRHPEGFDPNQLVFEGF